jgi:hypothetical protein
LRLRRVVVVFVLGVVTQVIVTQVIVTQVIVTQVIVVVIVVIVVGVALKSFLFLVPVAGLRLCSKV